MFKNNKTFTWRAISTTFSVAYFRDASKAGAVAAVDTVLKHFLMNRFRHIKKLDTL